MYALTVDERKRLSALDAANPIPKNQRWVQYLSIAYMPIYVIMLWQPAQHDPTLRILLIAILVLLAIIAGLFIVRLVKGKPHISYAASLRIDDNGIYGTIDDGAIVLSWKSVHSVVNSDEALFIRRSPYDQRTIAIPKRALSDPDAFWAMLDARLTATRGLRRAMNPRIIYNTAAR
jgi:hypothetical protein